MTHDRHKSLEVTGVLGEGRAPFDQAAPADPAGVVEGGLLVVKIPFKAGWELLEYVCLENNKDLIHLGTTEPK